MVHNVGQCNADADPEPPKAHSLPRSCPSSCLLHTSLLRMYRSPAWWAFSRTEWCCKGLMGCWAIYAGKDETAATREALKWPYKQFEIPQEAYDAFQPGKNRSQQAFKKWTEVSP